MDWLKKKKKLYFVSELSLDRIVEVLFSSSLKPIAIMRSPNIARQSGAFLASLQPCASHASKKVNFKRHITTQINGNDLQSKIYNLKSTHLQSLMPQKISSQQFNLKIYIFHQQCPLRPARSILNDSTSFCSNALRSDNDNSLFSKLKLKGEWHTGSSLV